jgi:hypothetical protein
MTFETLNEPIEAIVHFDGKTIYLLRFKWNGRSYNVLKTQHKWTERQGQTKFVHFKALADNSDLFEIVFNCETFEWKIVNVQLNG